jgi:hypothetical protein
MQVDLAEAAKFYGMKSVPTIIVDRAPGDFPGFSASDGHIHIAPDTFRLRWTADLVKRVEKLGVGRLGHEDQIRFEFAHELWHAAQYERDPKGMLRKGIELNIKMEMAELNNLLGMGNGDGETVHDANPMEQDADKHAAQAYKLVKLTRGTRQS